MLQLDAVYNILVNRFQLGVYSRHKPDTWELAACLQSLCQKIEWAGNGATTGTWVEVQTPSPTLNHRRETYFFAVHCGASSAPSGRVHHILSSLTITDAAFICI